MKKTVKINLNSLAFHIDEDAYEKLKQYLDSVKAHFSNHQDSQNIIEDIEVRIAELFQSKLSSNKQVINLDDVEQIINTLGRPSDFSDEEEDNAPGDAKGESYVYRKSKRLYRDHENGLLGGVSAGLGAYLNMDPLWARIAFVVLLFPSGFGAILYLIMWIVVPPARTTSEKLEMKGESVTLGNIEKSINDEYTKVKTSFNKFRSSDRFQNISDGLSDVGNSLGKALLALLKVLGVIVGVALIIAGIAALMGVTGVVFFDYSWVADILDISFLSVPEILEIYTHSEDTTLLLVSIFLALGLPLFVLIYGSIKLVFQVKTNDKALGLGVFVLWVLSSLFAVYILFAEKQEFRATGYNGDDIHFSNNGSSYLYIENPSDDYSPQVVTRFFFSDNEYGYSINDGERIYVGKPEINIRTSNDSLYHVSIIKESLGLNRQHAEMNANDIVFEYQLEDSVLSMDSYFRMDPNAKWRVPEVVVNIYVPSGKGIYIDENADDLFSYVNTRNGRIYSGFEEKYWLMTRDGLMPSDK